MSLLKRLRPYRDRINFFNNLLGASLLLLGLFSLGGCASRPLEPGGVYNGDQVLYEADNAIVTGHQQCQDFIDWVDRNKAALAAYPQVTQLADRIYNEGPKWFASANALRDAYKSDPTAENKSALNLSIDIIRSVMREASKYLTNTPIATSTNSPPTLHKPTGRTSFLLERNYSYAR